MLLGLGRSLLGRKKSSAWSPENLSSLAAWYKADSISQSDNTDVTTWTDSSGNGYDLTGYGTLPKFRTVQLGYAPLPIIRFGGAGYLSRTAWSGYPSNNSAKTVAAVFKANSGTASYYVTAGTVGQRRQDLVRMANDSATSFVPRGRILLRDEFGNFEYCDGGTTITNGQFPDGFHIYIAGNDSSTVPFIRLDGTSETLTFGGGYTDLSMTDSTPETFSIGGYSDGQFPLANRQEVCEVVFCDDSLSIGDREKLEGYLAHRWDLSVKLPINHPYKSKPPYA